MTCPRKISIVNFIGKINREKVFFNFRVLLQDFFNLEVRSYIEILPSLYFNGSKILKSFLLLFQEFPLSSYFIWKIFDVY